MNTIVYQTSMVFIKDDATGRILYSGEVQVWDPTPVVAAWGKPVGTMFGTYLELWACGQKACARVYPNADPRGLNIVLAEALGAKPQTPDEIVEALKGGRR